MRQVIMLIQLGEFIISNYIFVLYGYCDAIFCSYPVMHKFGNHMFVQNYKRLKFE